MEPFSLAERARGSQARSRRRNVETTVKRNREEVEQRVRKAIQEQASRAQAVTGTAQAVVGTVNADKSAFENAIDDLGIFMSRWPTALKSLITGRYRMDSYKELLLGDKSGIKNVIAIA